ncbi:MAG: hypothetical protein RQM92_11130 [Candidatus Syntrophopropionicum ammoniitolerans]
MPGVLRSRQPDKVIEAARHLVTAGYKEIVLTGIRTDTYGRGLEEDITLAGLIQRLLELPGLARLRLSSIEPRDITPELIQVMSGANNFAATSMCPCKAAAMKSWGAWVENIRRGNTWNWWILCGKTCPGWA